MSFRAYSDLADGKNYVSKEFVIKIVLMMVLFTPIQHHAQPFADEQMLQRLTLQHSATARQRGDAVNALLKKLAGEDVQ